MQWAVVTQVYFLGAEVAVQVQPSSTWLAEQAAAWPWHAHLLVNAPRSEALGVLGSEGMLVVFCSLVENLPYVAAEVGHSAIIKADEWMKSNGTAQQCMRTQPGLPASAHLAMHARELPSGRIGLCLSSPCAIWHLHIGLYK